MKKIDTVVFDLDGTLLNTLDDLSNSVNYALRTCGCRERSRDEVRRFLGNGVANLMRKAVPEEAGEACYAEALAVFRRYYMFHCLELTAPYEGICALLSLLSAKSYKLAIVSNKPQAAVTQLNERFFRRYIHVAIGESEGISRKPAPDTVNAALRQLGSSPEDAVYVGDSEVDIMTARNAGMPCISVTWGFRDRDFLEEHQAGYIAQNPDDVAFWVSRLSGESGE